MTEMLGGAVGIAFVCLVGTFLLFLSFAWIVLPFTISKKLDRLIDETRISNKLLDDMRHVQSGVPIHD